MAELEYELGELDLQSDLIKMIMEGADVTELQAYLRQGYDPRTRELIGMGMEDYEKLREAPPAYGENELQRFRDLISGDYFTDERAGSFRERVREGMQPTKDAMMADLSARGLATSGGEMGSALGRLGYEQNRKFQDIAVDDMMRAIGLGSEGLGAADTAMLNRAQTGYGMGANLRDFIESSQMNRVGIGANLAGMKQQDYMGLLNASTDWRQYQQSKPNTFEQIWGAAQPFLQAYAASGFTNPAAGLAGMAGGEMFDMTDLGQDNTQMFA